MKTWREMPAGRKILEGLCLALLVGSVLFLLALWGSLPDQIPGHYNAAGEIDRWGSKAELFLLPAVSGYMYLMLSIACAAVKSAVRRGELPPDAATWLAGVKLAVVAGFLCISLYMALCRPLPAGFTGAFAGLTALPAAGFLVSALRFAAARKAG